MGVLGPDADHEDSEHLDAKMGWVFLLPSQAVHIVFHMSEVAACQI